MKKIIILSLMTFLFVSCGTKETNEEFSTGSEVENADETTQKLVEDENNDTTSDTTTQNSTTDPVANDSGEKDSVPAGKDIDTNSTPQSDDQLVEDTIKDIESLFNDIEESVK